MNNKTKQVSFICFNLREVSLMDGRDVSLLLVYIWSFNSVEGMVMLETLTCVLVLATWSLSLDTKWCSVQILIEMVVEKSSPIRFKLFLQKMYALCRKSVSFHEVTTFRFWLPFIILQSLCLNLQLCQSIQLTVAHK
jgi:hypothetical protein